MLAFILLFFLILIIYKNDEKPQPEITQDDGPSLVNVLAFISIPIIIGLVIWFLKPMPYRDILQSDMFPDEKKTPGYLHSFSPLASPAPNPNNINNKYYLNKLVNPISLQDLKLSWFMKEDVPGDGSCLFHAVGRQIQKNPQYLRKVINNYAKVNKDDPLRDELLKIGSCPNEWATEAVFPILAQELNICFLIYRDVHPQQWEFVHKNLLHRYMNIRDDSPNDCNTVYIYGNNMHFQILKPKPEHKDKIHEIVNQYVNFS